MSADTPLPPDLTLPPEILAMMASFEAQNASPASDDVVEPTDASIAALPAPLLVEDAESAAEDAAVLALPPVLDITAAGKLHADLLARRGQPLRIDGADVKRLGGQCLQLLVSAGRTWGADGVPIRLANSSDALMRDLALFGIEDPLHSDAA